MNKKLITTEVISDFLSHGTTGMWGELRIVVAALCTAGYAAACLAPLGVSRTFPVMKQNVPDITNVPGQNNPWLRISGLLLYGLAFKGRMRKVLT